MAYEDLLGTEILADKSIIYNMDFRPGDVVQICNAGSNGTAGNAWHTMFITKKENGEYYLTYHSHDNLNKKLTDFISTSSEYENSYYRFYKVR